MPMLIRFRALQINPNRFDVAKATPEVERYMQDFLHGIIQDTSPYPAPPPNSRYVRRGVDGGLLGGWRITKVNVTRGLEYRIINLATDRRSGRRYMQYVQGFMQTALHQATGWQRIDLAASALRRKYRADLQAIYSRHIRRGP